MPDTGTVVAADRNEADCTLIIERVFNAPPAEVFAAWTDPAILTRWWGPEGHSTPECDMDVRPGGAWRTKLIGPDGDHIVSGVYREIAPPSRLVFTGAGSRRTAPAATRPKSPSPFSRSPPARACGWCRACS
jgi:uncharacterized protein YndB with AHSA1/START domain